MSDASLDCIFLPRSTRRKRSLEQLRNVETQPEIKIESSSPQASSLPNKAMPSMQEIEIHNDLLRSRPGSPFFRGDSPEVASIPFQTPTSTGDRLQETIMGVTNAVSKREFSLSSRTVGRAPDNTGENDDSDDSDSETSDDDAHLGPFIHISPAGMKFSKGRSVVEMIDDGGEETNEIEQVKKLHKKVPARIAREPAGKKRLRDDSADRIIDAPGENQGGVYQGRNLRKRTLIQERPYQADKVRHQKSQKSGSVVGDAEVEEEIKATQRKTSSNSAETTSKAQPKPREVVERLSSVSTAASASTTPATATPDPGDSDKQDIDQILRNTTLWVLLHGGDDTAVPIQLSECPSLTSLFEAIRETWGKDKGKTVKQVQAILPWKTENKKILMRDGWESVWRIMMNQILRAPIWANPEKGDGVLEVKLVATLD